MKKNQSGFSIVEVLIVVVILAVIGLVGFKVLAGDKKKDDFKPSSSQSSQTSSGVSSDKTSIWQQTADGWQATQKAPACPTQPMLKMPADISIVTSVLYPGQTRGMYKPHGGLRFDNSTDNKITVSAPIDGYIVKATRNFAQGTTEVQYGFDIMNNCGVMVRFGHLRELTPDMQKIVEKLPAASADSRIEPVNPAVYVKQGQILATKVGLLTEKNTFFDWGVYDYRQENEASKAPAFQVAHPEKEMAWHGVCWLQGWLPSKDQTTLAALNSDNPASKMSDYCK